MGAMLHSSHNEDKDFSRVPSLQERGNWNHPNGACAPLPAPTKSNQPLRAFQALPLREKPLENLQRAGDRFLIKTRAGLRTARLPKGAEDEPYKRESCTH